MSMSEHIMRKRAKVALATFVAAVCFALATMSCGAQAFADESLSTQADEGVAVYRLYNDVTSEHLFTTSRGEAVTLANNYSEWNWLYEGVSWVAPSSGTPVHRLYNPYLGHHLYTSSSVEIASLVAHWDWNDEGVFFYSGGAQSIYRLYNPYLYGLHLITTSAHEYSILPAHQWNQEGEVFRSLGDGNTAPASEQLTWVAPQQQWVPNNVYVVDQAAYSERVAVRDDVVCGCGLHFSTTSEWLAHATSLGRGNSCSYSVSTIYDTISHPEIGHYEDRGHYEIVPGHWE